MASEADSENPALLPVNQHWRDSLLGVMRQVVHTLPDQTDLGELISAIRSTPTLSPLLENMSVQELIEMAVSRPYSKPAFDFSYEERSTDAASEAAAETGASVIRRRADSPDGDRLILQALAKEDSLNETMLTRVTCLTSEQIRLLTRNLRSKGLIHLEGSGSKRRIKITRNGSQYLRAQQHPSRG